MNSQVSPQQHFQQALLVQERILEGRKEVMLQTKLALKIKKLISCKNEKLGEILVIIILFMFDKTSFVE